MDSDLRKRALEIIEDNQYINIATEDNSQPWSTPVYAVNDKELNFYWSSWVHAQHSKNIRNNSKIFITIFDSTRRRGDNHRRGVYIKAIAQELDNSKDIEEAFKYFKSVDGSVLKPRDFLGSSPKRMYRAVTMQIWLNDLSESKLTDKTIKMRIEVPS